MAAGADVAAPSGLPLTLEDVIFEENPWSGELLVVGAP